MRAKHYAEEKECMARKYKKLLRERTEALISENELNQGAKIKEIIIILESVTTIANIFEQLGKESYLESEHWTKKSYVKFFTNSIRGVLCLFNYRDQASRYSEIPFKCNIFPGKILSPYEAIADENTVNAILNLKKDGRYIIFVTTGNYLIYNTKDNVFLPIARAGFHPDVKAAGFHISDEVHVVAPLGKILMNSPTKSRDENISQTLERFNIALGYSQNPRDESLKNYSLVDPVIIKNCSYLSELSESQKEAIQNDEMQNWLKKSVLITSSREAKKDHWLAEHSAVIRHNLNSRYDPKRTVMPNTTHTPFVKSYPFSGLPLSPELQVKIEIPHDNLRKKEILSDFFEVEARQ